MRGSGASALAIFTEEPPRLGRGTHGFGDREPAPRDALRSACVAACFPGTVHANRDGKVGFPLHGSHLSCVFCCRASSDVYIRMPSWPLLTRERAHFCLRSAPTMLTTQMRCTALPVVAPRNSASDTWGLCIGSLRRWQGALAAVLPSSWRIACCAGCGWRTDTGPKPATIELPREACDRTGSKGYATQHFPGTRTELEKRTPQHCGLPGVRGISSRRVAA